MTSTPVPLTPFTAAAAAATRPATPAAAVTVQAAAPTEPDAATTPVNLSLTPPAVAMNVVSEALRKAGIEPSGLNLYYEETTVGYPGGSYTCRYITCELPNGNKESYDVGLMMKNPGLTAFEIRRQMGYRA